MISLPTQYLPLHPILLFIVTSSILFSIILYIYHHIISHHILLLQSLITPHRHMEHMDAQVSSCHSSVDKASSKWRRSRPTTMPEPKLGDAIPSESLYTASFLPSYLPSYLPFFLPSFLPFFLPSFLPSYVPSFLPSFLPFNFFVFLISSFLQSFISFIYLSPFTPFTFLPSSRSHFFLVSSFSCCACGNGLLHWRVSHWGLVCPVPKGSVSFILISAEIF